MSEQKFKEMCKKIQINTQVPNMIPSKDLEQIQIISEHLDTGLAHSRKMIFIAELITLLFSIRTNTTAVKFISEIIISVLKTNSSYFLDKTFSKRSFTLFQPVKNYQLIDIVKKYHIFFATAYSQFPATREKFCQIERFLIKWYLKNL